MTPPDALDWLTQAIIGPLNEVHEHLDAQQPQVPAGDLTYRAFTYVKPEDVRVVVLGQDPYHHVTPAGTTKANGLAFGLNPAWVAETQYTPHSSWANLLREVARTAPGGIVPPDFDASLESWARQGVLLVNTRLSCAPGLPRSHFGVGWEAVVQELLRRVLPAEPVWLLWGSEALECAARVLEPVDGSWGAHHVLTATHPCRYSATRRTRWLDPFVGCDHFRAANEILTAAGREPIKWV